MIIASTDRLEKRLQHAKRFSKVIREESILVQASRKQEE
jgi:hypothetical protein